MKNMKFSSRLVAMLIAIMMLATAVPAMAMTTEPIYKTAYASKQEAIEAGAALNLQIASEGMVLLKNENKALPLAKDATKVTVFGYGGIRPGGGGNMDERERSGGVVTVQEDIYSSLVEAGYELNPTVKASYEEWLANEEVNNDFTIASLNSNEQLDTLWKDSFAEYKDAAIVVLSSGASEARTHSLQFDAEQYALVDYAAQNFDTVIVLINSTKPNEVPQLKANENVDAILVVGEPGDNGFAALGNILNGSVNPSGRLPDVWATDFTTAPSYVNYNTTNDGSNGYGKYTVDGVETDTYFVQYEEGIYVGYRYYETRAFEEKKADEKSTWWEDNVTYAFGHGLSYTNFTWDVAPATAADAAITAQDTLSFDVTVTNAGDVAGKDVVQLYYTAPYGDETTNPTKIEKSYVVLGDFAKTKELAPGESETLTLTLPVSDMASYDYVTDKTYVLDDGAYNVKISRDAHDVVTSFNYTVAEKALLNTSVTGATVTNQFDDVTEGYLAITDARLSRADFAGTMPTAAPANIALTAEEYTAWDGGNFKDEEGSPWYVAEADMPTQATADTRPETAAVVLDDLIGKDIDDPLWETLLDEMTLEEMTTLINNGGFHSVNIDYVGKPYAHDTDGPKGWTGTGRDADHEFNKFATEPMIASTFNKQLAYDMGEMIGEQGLWGNSTAQSGMAYNYTGWYAPGMNIHRSPFDSRLTEYYSEDAFLTGALATNASLGATTKGCYVSLKHFAFHNDGGGTNFSVNEDGSYNISGYRGAMNNSPTSGLSAWFDEQTAREIYLKGYQMAVEEGKATFAMASFTRAGTTWCGGSYALNTEILRNEWGFKGSVVTDIVIYGYLNANQMIRAGVNSLLDYSGQVFGSVVGDGTVENTATQVTAMRNAVKHIMYMVANSNAMQLPLGAKVAYVMPSTVNEEGDTIVMTIDPATVGTAFETPALNTATLNVYGATAAISYTAEGVPEGLTFDAETGIISGTPTTAGTYTVTVTATADAFQPASVDYTIVVE